MGHSRVRTKKNTNVFPEAVLKGTRSGLGMLVADIYDQLVAIYDGPLTAEHLEFGC